MKRLDFYFKYAWRSILRGGQRTFFALLCVAIGVAALVALQSLAVSIRETLIGDIQSRAGGDVVASVNSPTSSAGGGFRLVSPEAEQYLEKLKADGKLQEWTALVTDGMQIKGYFSLPPSLYIVDPAHFPLYGNPVMEEPKGGNFRQLLAQPNSIILSKYLWDKNDYKLGQEIEVTGLGGGNSGSAVRLKIVGMVKPDVPGVPFDTGFIFGFGMVSPPTAATFLDVSNQTGGNNSVYLKTPPDSDNKALVNEIKRANSTQPDNLSRVDSGLFYNVRTAAEIQTQVSKQLDTVDDLLSYIGLLAILIGGIGVVNTMLVVIGRRTTEIATVKALGLKSRQTITIFTLEALILGTLGSLLGVVLGVALGFGIKGVAEGFFFRPLNWGFYPGPLIVGMVVGILTSGVFGFLPSYAAGRVRPAIVLRQQSSALPRIGGFATFLIIILMTLALGIIAGILLKDIVVGIIVAFVTLIVCLLMTAGMYLIVWLVGKLPAPFGPSFKMALRSFSRHRGRTATTLLVMTIGLFFITFIVIIADSLKSSIKEAFDVNLGYNVVGLNLLSAQTERIQSSLETEVPGLKKVFAGNNSNVELVSINGTRPAQPTTPPRLTPGPNNNQNNPNNSNNSEQRDGVYINISGRSLANGESISPNGTQTLVAGRNFTPADMDKKVLLLLDDEAARYKVKVGDKVSLQFSASRTGFGNNQAVRPAQVGSPTEFEVIGILGKGGSQVQFERNWVAPYRAVAEGGNQFSIFYMLVDRAQIKPALTKVQALLLGGFVFDLGDLIDTFNRILDQVLAFPLLLSLLSLFSGAILVANNVALAVLERRTEIGVLKAIGAKRRRVFNILLWESGLVGFLGGFIGVGTGIVLALLVPVLVNATSRNGGGNSIPISWSPLTAALLLALGIGLAIIATLVSAWGAVQEKPLVVLRYE